MNDKSFMSDKEILWHIQNHSDELLLEARRLKEHYYGDRVFMRGLIEFSNICKNDCLYCGIRRSNAEIARYRLSEEDILASCRLADELGYKTFVMQSGEDAYFDDEKMVSVVEKVRAEFPEHAITLSLGERSKESYKRLFDAGADRYLLRHETATDSHYAKLHPKEMSLENRKKCLYELKEIGYQVGAGLMVGSPFQTDEDLVRDIRFLEELDPAMVGIGPFISHKDTPFKDFPNGSVDKTIRMVALTRLALPKALIPATTAVATLHPLGRERALLAGANVLMPNVSPMDVRKKYMLYDNKICTDDRADQCRNCSEGRVESLKMHIDLGRGDYCGGLGEK
ncbi:MAG: [FeFe] hydrogenase H-cluster radical SAM maturase HydE [Lactobacillales bacterium]|jgi:biotin synthase|nr:[FeFe] hydrogenase H-cluster radical SAM maturase HydE [Lactobacillales bacterium]